MLRRYGAESTGKEYCVGCEVFCSLFVLVGYLWWRVLVGEGILV